MVNKQENKTYADFVAGFRYQLRNKLDYENLGADIEKKRIMAAIWSVDDQGAIHSFISTFEFPQHAMKAAMNSLAEHCNLPEPVTVPKLPMADVNFEMDDE